MKMRMYCLRDRKVGFLAPVLALNDELAMRDVANALRRGTGTLIDTHPEDFSLYCIGEFDQDVGVVVSLSVPECVCEVTSLYE